MCVRRNHRCRLIGVACLAFLIGIAVSLDSARAQETASSHAAAPEGHASEHSAVEHSGGHGGFDYDLPPLYFDPVMFAFTLILFGGYVMVMKVAVWQPLAKSLDAREGRIAQAEADAEATRLEIEKLSEQAETRLAEVHQQVGAILAKARSEAEARKAEITAKAEAEAQRIKSEALASIDQARQAALTQLEARAQEQVALATEHLAGSRF